MICKRLMTVRAADVLRSHCFTASTQSEPKMFLQSAGFALKLHAGITCGSHVCFFFSLRNVIIAGDVK